MVKVKEIVSKIEEFAPCELAYDWDNTGFITGDPEKEVKKVYITLDMFKENADEAAECGADMVISHHPVLFKGIQKIDLNSQDGYVIKKLIENDIALYAAHTSVDCAEGGINDILAKKLGLKETRVIEENDKNKNAGLGRVGTIENSVLLKDFANEVKKALNTPCVRVCGDLDREIKTVAVGGGACDDLIEKAKELGADVMVTADMKYHISAQSVDSGICVIDAGHFPTEVFVIDIFEDIIKGMGVEIVKSTGTDVFKFI